MADKKTTEAPEVQDNAQNDPEPNPSTGTADTAVADQAGISEGEVRALRADAGLDRLAGHEGHILAWAASPQGKEFAEGEKDREKAAKEEQKAYEAQFHKDGLTEAEVKFREATGAK